ncbi:DUF1846 domain-containing protein [Candidatus Woesearchaeota archaeon]|nr:DUF1846 domain-containing protein [Candidatus Woesearchaeota archaeon]
MKTGFSTKKYLEVQTKEIKDRVAKFGEKLYLEFGGKLCHDFHAVRVLPGYEPDTKIEVLKALGDKIELIYCVSAQDIQKGRIRHDFGLAYDKQVMKDLKDLKERGLNISIINIALFSGEEAAVRFKRKLENFGYKVFTQPVIEGYPNDIKKVVSDEGYGGQTYIPTSKPIVIITGAGGGSGKMALCLSQMYHDTKKGINSGYAKFETFPIWNLEIDHPINVAYEAATADLGDVNMVDPFHLKQYKKTSINYNRDIENFDIMKNIMDGIVSKDNHVRNYNSPTDMGVNMAGFAIIDDKVCREAAKQEIIRRYFRYKKELLLGTEKPETVERAENLMQKLHLKEEDRKVVPAARNAEKEAEKAGKGNKGIFCGAAIQLPDGTIVAGKNSPLLHAESSVVINAIKTLAGVDDGVDLILPEIIKNVNILKGDILKGTSESLNLDETLIALAVSAKYNKETKKCIKMLGKLNNCDMHVTYLPSEGDEAGLIKLRMNVTTDAKLTFRNTG